MSELSDDGTLFFPRRRQAPDLCAPPARHLWARGAAPPAAGSRTCHVVCAAPQGAVRAGRQSKGTP